MRPISAAGPTASPSPAWIPATDTQVINDGIAAGLNVITFDTDAPNSKRLMYVGHNGDYDDGFKSGEVMAKKIGGKGSVGILIGSLAAPNHVNRVKGFKDAIAKYKDITVAFEAADNDDIQKAMDMTESALQAHPDVKGIYANNAEQEHKSHPGGAERREGW